MHSLPIFLCGPHCSGEASIIKNSLNDGLISERNCETAMNCSNDVLRNSGNEVVQDEEHRGLREASFCGVKMDF